MTTIGVIGAGAWGTALAQVFAKGGRDTAIWGLETDVVQSINMQHENNVFLPGIPLDKSLKATASLEEISARDIILMVTPAQFVRKTMQQIQATIAGKPVVICAKGIELNTGLLLSEVAAIAAPKAEIAILTGPTFAAEIARGLPAAVTIAAANQKLAERLQSALAVNNFRPYTSTDVAGAQLAGAVKNVIAIACGIVHGRKLGESARAAVIARGLSEIARLGAAMGAKTETLLGMCGIGDLVLTCSSMQSRNFSLGAALGEGKTLDEILGARKAVTEGVYTAKATCDLAHKKSVEMPITNMVNACLNENLSVDMAIRQLLERPLKDELA